MIAVSAISVAATSPAYATKEEENDVVQNSSADKSKANGETVVQPAASKGTEAGQASLQKEVAKNGKNIRLALTLAGGGSRGAAHIGVLKVFDREGIKPDFISGSSVGAMIGSLYAAGVSPAQLEKLALEGKFKKAYFPIPKNVKSFFYSVPYFAQRAVLLKPKIGLYSGKSISRFIEKNLPEGVENFEDLKIPVAVTAINLVDTKPVWLTKGSIAQAVRVSNTVPFMYKIAGPKDGPQLVDGGIRTNLPTEIAEAAGAPLVVAVKLHSYLEKVSPKEFDTNTDMADRVTSIFMAEIEGKGVGDADILVEPEVQYMTMHSFDRKSMERAIAAGEAAAEKQVSEIKRRLATTDVAHNEKPNQSFK
ncbi:MAG: patatin-like phospholipase family protein [Candidatus Melainabacteria bacterium]|nr:patatin-like phospholipase family protein [Candidatus Melainabacteria bacterium]